MPASVLLPLLVCAAIGIPIAFVLWRVFVVGGELRRDAAHGRAAMDIARRADTSLAELAELVDLLRRRKATPLESAASLAAAADGLRHYAAEADAVDKAASTEGSRTLVSEIERAQRAVDLIEHGRQQMLAEGENAYAEGETSVKRGYLNLMHARDALKARAAEIAEEAAAPAGSKSIR
jgi:hypothetical protein